MVVLVLHLLGVKDFSFDLPAEHGPKPQLSYYVEALSYKTVGVTQIRSA